MSSSNTIKPDFIRGMQAIHMALVAGVSLFLILILGLFFINHSVGFLGTIKRDLDLIFITISYIFALGGSALGIIVFEKNMKDAKRFTFIKEKALIFRTAYLIRMGLHEAGAFIGIIFFMLGGNYYILGGTAICLIALIGARPTKEFVTYKLYLTEEEGEEIAAL